ncbi:PDR/VanB family oxidoreductase [Mycolicibacterium thermoresistibile]
MPASSLAPAAVGRPRHIDDEIEAVVVTREPAANGVVLLEFTPLDAQDFPAWQPGAHIDVILDEATVRQYSLCGSPEDSRRWRIAVLREENGRGGSARMHQEISVGDRVLLRGPRNNFKFVEAPRYIFVAGGIGITPLLPMVSAAAAAGAEWTLFYGGRTRSSMAFTESLSSYGNRVLILPEDECGLLPLAEIFGAESVDAEIYCCGPQGLLDAVEQASQANGAARKLHIERFAPLERQNDVPDNPLRVICKQSDIEVEVPATRSILEVLQEAGVDVPSSCREGTCGSCETDVLEGRPLHRDSVLMPDEKESGEVMMICVSRSLDDTLVLDL